MDGLSRYRVGSRLILLTALLLPGVASAHSPIKGLGNLYNGMLHPLFVPAHLLLVLGLGLLLGQQGVMPNLRSAGAYIGGLLLGLCLAWRGVVLHDALSQELSVLGAAVAAALLVVLAARLPSWSLALLGGLAGLLLGLDSAQSELVGRARAVALFGSGVSLYLLLLYPMALAERLQTHHWLRVGTRVVASWIAASALLVLALMLAPAS
jgi:hydrogenase/urease accessory protein HupE